MTQMVKAKLNGNDWTGYEIILPKHRADRPEWYTTEGWEKKRLKSIQWKIMDDAESGKNPVMFYIGAEEGEMAALCQMWGAKVVLFEPNPKVWPNIKAIWEANDLGHPAGWFEGFASDITKDAVNPQTYKGIGEDKWPLCANEEIIGNHGFKELDKEADSYDQLTIDDYVKKTGIIPTAISLDVEGSEGKVLRGAEDTLKKHHPVIWLSGHPEFLHENFAGAGGFLYLRQLRDWLKKDLGYKEQLIDFDHEVHLYYWYE